MPRKHGWVSRDYCLGYPGRPAWMAAENASNAGKSYKQALLMFRNKSARSKTGASAAVDEGQGQEEKGSGGGTGCWCDGDCGCPEWRRQEGQEEEGAVHPDRGSGERFLEVRMHA